MNPRKFFIGRVIGLLILSSVIGLVAGLYSLNNYLNREKLAENEGEPPVFTWRFEQADSLNLDGVPNTDVFLEVRHPDGEVQTKLVDTTAGSCNELPESDPDSLPGSANTQCYAAGLGQRFKIVKGEQSYLIMRKTFGEALPDYEPPAYEYEVVTEVPLY